MSSTHPPDRGAAPVPEPAVPEWMAPLTDWLVDRLPGVTDVVLEGAGGASSGFSAETLVVETLVTRDGATGPERFVLRRENPEPAIYPVQVPGWAVEIELQYRVMDALARHSTVPVAPLLGYEADAALLGAPFFVMGHVPGEVPVEDPPYAKEGFFVDASAEQRTALLERGVAVMAAVHEVDWRAAGLEWLVPPGTTPGIDAQLALWERYARDELRDRVHPLMEHGWRWLRDHPPAPSDVGLCWGDPRPGNMRWHDFECVCATDFEAASIAPPELDVGWWIMFDHTMHEWAGVARLPGDLTRDDQLAAYERASGRTVRDIEWWEICAAVRYCAIVVRVMNRAVDRGLMPADHTIWLENPPTTVLEQLLEGR
jgi:aminoglycoside phosphotransferase (APT) family kinase protein